MKLYTTGILISFAMFISLESCNKHPDQYAYMPGTWDKQPANFIGASRSAAVSFTIGDTAYVGTGFSYDSGRMSDLWKYDPSKNSWSKKAPFPGIGRSNAIAFTLNGKGYVGTGLAADQSVLSDFYEFDPTDGPKGKWTQVADFPTARAGSLAFVVKGKAFVGSGQNSGGADLKDLWQYDQANNAWVAQTAMGGAKRTNGFVMVINDIAYVGGGTDNGQYTTDFYKFDITQNEGTGAWIALNGLTGKNVNGEAIVQPSPRALAVTFTVGNYGYLSCGITSSKVAGDTWQYDPTRDTWIQFFSITSNVPSGAARYGAVGFTITSGDFGYLITGEKLASIQYNDFWKFNPRGIEQDNK